MLHTVKADSQKLHLMHAAVEDISISAEIGIFYFSTLHTSAAAARIKCSLCESAFSAICRGLFGQNGRATKLALMAGKIKLVSKAVQKWQRWVQMRILRRVSV